MRVRCELLALATNPEKYGPQTILLHLGKSADTVQRLTIEEENKVSRSPPFEASHSQDHSQFRELRDAYLPVVQQNTQFYPEYQDYETGAISPSSDGGATSSSGTYVASEPDAAIFKPFPGSHPSFN